jgi:hypothetical protein
MMDRGDEFTAQQLDAWRNDLEEYAAGNIRWSEALDRTGIATFEALHRACTAAGVTRAQITEAEIEASDAFTALVVGDLDSPHDILSAFSAGKIAAGYAVTRLRVDGLAELFHAMADAGLALSGGAHRYPLDGLDDDAIGALSVCMCKEGRPEARVDYLVDDFNSAAEAAGKPWRIAETIAGFALVEDPDGAGQGATLLDLAESPLVACVRARRAVSEGVVVTRRVADLADMLIAVQARSGARELLAGCERYRRVVLDFEGVRSAAPSFADEIFRVWQTAHPSVDIEVVNVAAELVPWLRRGGWQPPAAG